MFKKFLNNLIEPLSISKIGNHPLRISRALKIKNIGLIIIGSPGMNDYKYSSEEILFKINEPVAYLYSSLTDSSGCVLSLINRGNDIVAYSTPTQHGSFVGTVITLLK